MRRPIKISFPLVFVLGTLAVGSIAGGLSAQLATAPPPHHASVSTEDAVSQSLKSFTRFYSVVEQNFADPAKVDPAVYEGAIPGMLNTLDPHSHFFDPKAFAAMQDDNREVYYGVGMTVRQDGDKDHRKTLVVAPFTATPAYRAGLRPGDVIEAVDDKPTEGLDTNAVTTMLKGPRGTRVKVTVSRYGVDKPISVSIVRDQIPRPSVSEAVWLHPGVAYVKVSQFKDNTHGELEDNLGKLGEDQIRGLVLDLRGNPGGLLNEGIAVAGHFLKKGQLVVSDRGRVKPATNYNVKTNGGKDYPIVVLVNRNSASAAEIVSGALQDHDRGWVLGETTFGKGLVQEVLRLSDNAGLALTTMHYYTPSGRLIQRDYSNISFLDYYMNSSKKEQKNLDDVKTTDSGRTVYGGGGITPDEKYVAPKYNSFQIENLRKFAFFKFAAQYFGPKQQVALPKGWEPDEKLVNQYHQFLLDNKIKFTEAEFTENHQWVKDELKDEMYITAFNIDESDKARVLQDKEVAAAVDSMPKAKALLETNKQVIVKR